MITAPPRPSHTRPLTSAMRRLLLLATALVVLAGISLYLAPQLTEDWFSWTVTPPVTAAVLGAAYWASASVEWTSARATAWAHARVAVPSVFVFTLATLVVTLVHLDRFHLGADVPVPTRTIAWVWIAIYALVPVLMAVVWWRQQRLGGDDPPRERPLPWWLLGICAALGVMLVGLGMTMLVVPDVVIAWWPWELTPLTARAIGAWVLGLGVSALGVVLERDARRSRPVAVGAVVLPLLAGIALVRELDDVDWQKPSAAGVVVVLAMWASVGLVLLRQAHAQPRSVGVDQ